MRVGRLVIPVFFAVFLLPKPVSAHGIGEVYKLPIPLEYYLLGATLAVAISFLALGLFSKKPVVTRPKRSWRLQGLGSAIAVLRLISLGLFLLMIFSGLFGRNLPYLNFSTVYFWVYFFVGYALVSGLIGNIWDKLSPWQTLASFALKSPAQQKILPKPVGIAPLFLFFGLAWWELVSVYSSTPSVVGLVFLIYTVFVLWVANNYTDWQKIELFTQLYRSVGSIAPLIISEDNRTLSLRKPAIHLTGQAVNGVGIGLLAIFIAQASFDSIKETIMWANLLEFAGSSGSSSSLLLYGTIGLLLTIGLVYGVFRLAIAIMRGLLGSRYSSAELASWFAWSLAPIALGYVVAHNLGLFVVSAPALIAQLSDPFGFGWNLIQTASFAQGQLILGAKAVWFMEIGAIIAAHIGGVWLAHVIALKRFKTNRLALRSQYPMMALMLFFTIGTLWLLSQTIVSG